MDKLVEKSENSAEKDEDSVQIKKADIVVQKEIPSEKKSEFDKKTNSEKEKSQTIEQIVKTVYDALEEKGYNALDQMVGYILSGDPSYITGHNNARNIIRQVERDRLVCGSDCCRSRHERKNQFLQAVPQLLRYESCRVPDAYSGFKTCLAVLI